MRDEALWLRLNEAPLRLSDGSTLGESLARTGKLGTPKAEAFVAEYRRLLYLMATAEAPETLPETLPDALPVAPPAALLAVWGRHRADRPAYDSFCETVIGRPVLRSKGQTHAIGNDAYRALLARYAAEFGTAPLARIWPSPRDVEWARNAPLAFLAAMALLGLGLLLGWLWLTVAGLSGGVVIFLWSKLAGPWQAKEEGEEEIDEDILAE